MLRYAHARQGFDLRHHATGRRITTLIITFCLCYLLAAFKVVFKLIVELSFARLAIFTDEVDENIGVGVSIRSVAGKY